MTEVRPLSKAPDPRLLPVCVCVCVRACALGWVKCREHISLLVILCIIVYVTNKAHLSLIIIIIIIISRLVIASLSLYPMIKQHTVAFRPQWFLSSQWRASIYFCNFLIDECKPVHERKALLPCHILRGRVAYLSVQMHNARLWLMNHKPSLHIVKHQRCCLWENTVYYNFKKHFRVL